MKATIVTCFESNEQRVDYVYETCIEKGFDVSVISTDFSHINKKKRDSIPEGYSLIKTKEYSRNLSFERIESHIKFAKDGFNLIKKQRPDLIWLMVPANSLLKQAKEYKKENSDVKIIVDVIDMWPESLPIFYNKDLFPLNIWKNLRKNNIDCADYLVTECNMYHEILKKEYSNSIDTLYWSKDNVVINNDIEIDKNRLSLCYLGSINNIIDIDQISKIISTSDSPVDLHIVGDGEKKQEMLDKLSNVCYVIDHGIVLDEKEKEKIIGKCHGGINIYKKDLYIGLTMKCIDYFKYGLPIINNIQADTWDLIDKYNVGINVDENTILNSEEIISMRFNNANIHNLYNTHFSKDVFINKCGRIIDEVLK